MRARAVLQLASTVRLLGRAAESVELLRELLPGLGDLHQRAACAAFLGLALTDCGRPREAVGVVLEALAPLLPEYGTSIGRYARSLP